MHEKLLTTTTTVSSHDCNNVRDFFCQQDYLLI